MLVHHDGFVLHHLGLHLVSLSLYELQLRNSIFLQDKSQYHSALQCMRSPSAPSVLRVRDGVIRKWRSLLLSMTHMVGL